MLALRVSKVAVDSYFIGQSLVIEINTPEVVTESEFYKTLQLL